MQSFASPPPLPHNPPHRHKNHKTKITPRPQKRAQLSPIPTPFLPQKTQKGRNYRPYLKKNL